MPVPSAISDLSTTPASNSPTGSETPSSIDDYLRTSFAFIRQLDTGKYGKNTILGAVSQTAGIPTGAIIESGSNASGSYIRYADGTQICTHTLTAAGAINNAEGSVFVTPDTTWTFPAAFVSTIPVVSGSGVSTVGGVWLAAGNADRSLTAAPIKLVRSTTSTGTPVFSVQAVGRWF